ncbi:hypothetical protein [Frankia sp. Cj3]|uniref:hypothetical protein n=1 Tax=Frankia sp. Cj3 TaxID=2880976 RepID=UPI001EF73FE3|nr:hypothetical protein [Frankia sp. Cj3]
MPGLSGAAAVASSKPVIQLVIAQLGDVREDWLSTVWWSCADRGTSAGHGEGTLVG